MTGGGASSGRATPLSLFWRVQMWTGSCCQGPGTGLGLSEAGAQVGGHRRPLSAQGDLPSSPPEMEKSLWRMAHFWMW